MALRYMGLVIPVSSRHPLVLAILVAVGSGCVASASVPNKAPCVDDTSCLSGESCQAGLCVVGAALEAGCASDLDCNVAAGEACANNVCVGPPVEAPAQCAETSECPLDSFCNVASQQCEPLLADWCRVDSQCDAAAPFCGTDSPGRTGTCFECRTNDDCGGLACLADHTCEEPPPPPVECPPNSSLVPGSTTICQCDEGYLPNLDTESCEPVGDGDEPDTTTCVPNASPVPGVPGQCRCDAGFEPSDDGASCVPADATPPPPPPPPDNGGGDPDPGGGDPVDDGNQCGPNAVPVFFLCVCLPGYVVNQNGSGCVSESQSGGGGGCPANSYNGGDGYCYCYDGFVASGNQCVPANGGGNNSGGCPANSYNGGDGYCYCYDGYYPNGNYCEVDFCAQNGYYGDGYYCDQCPYQDPDCY